jgi:hypothetical protein
MKKLVTLSLFLCLVFVGQAYSSAGLELKDPTRGVKFTAPNGLWSVNAGKYSISLTHQTHYDANVTLKKSYQTVASAADAYANRKKSLKSYLPGAVFMKENEAVTIGAITGQSMTYKNPSDLKVIREIMFIHNGLTYELVFKSKEENLPKVQADFTAILGSMELFK